MDELERAGGVRGVVTITLAESPNGDEGVTVGWDFPGLSPADQAKMVRYMLSKGAFCFDEHERQQAQQAQFKAMQDAAKLQRIVQPGHNGRPFGMRPPI